MNSKCPYFTRSKALFHRCARLARFVMTFLCVIASASEAIKRAGIPYSLIATLALTCNYYVI